MGFADLALIDVTGWSERQREQRGKRSKVWVIDPRDNSSWLRKSVSESPPRPYEHLIEAFVLELARQCGVDSAFARPCFWTERGTQCDGLLSQSFVGDDQSHVSGAEFLSPFVRPLLEQGIAENYAYSLELVLESLPSLEQAAPGARLALLHVLAFDAWVGKGDRHSENWSLVARPATQQRYLAPMYDPAACLGSELLEARVKLLISNEDRLAKYILNCPSGFGDGKSRVLKMSDVVQRLVELPEWQSNIQEWLQKFEAGLDLLQQALFEGVSWLPESRQSLALQLLKRRLQWLKGCSAPFA
jgi:hypothetical protein